MSAIILPNALEPVSFASIVEPAPLNRLQRALFVSHDLALFAPRTSYGRVGDIALSSGMVKDAAGQSVASTGVADQVDWYVRLPAGARITGWSAWVQAADVDPILAALFEVDLADGSVLQLGATESTGGAGIAELSETGLTLPVEAGKAYFVRWESGQSADALAAVLVTWDYDETTETVETLDRLDLLTAAKIHALQDKLVAHEAVARGARTIALGVGATQTDASVGTPLELHASRTYWEVSGANQAIYASVQLEAGERIVAWTGYGSEGGAGGTTITGKLWRINMATSGRTQIGSSQVSPGADGGNLTVGEASLDAFQVAGSVYQVELSAQGAANGKQLYGVALTVDRPASVPA